MTYEAYESQVVPRFEAIEVELRQRWPQTGRVVLMHRTGTLELGESSVIVVVSAPHRGEQEMRYPGTCRGRFASLEAANEHSGASACLRFLVRPGRVTVDDVLAGPHHFDVSDEVGDFPILRRDQSPAYQLAVVVDDQYDGVTEVLRGNDLLASAARQQLIYQALGFETPRWIHVPLVVDQQGRRLAKRTDALSLAHLRQRGMRPSDVVAWVARSIGIFEGQLDSVHDVTPHFQLNRLAPEPVVVSEDSLLSA